MQHGTLDHTLEAKGWLSVDLIGPAYRRGMFFDVLAEFVAQGVEFCPAGTQHFCSGGVIQHSK